MCERRPEGRELRGLSCRGGVGTNCIERCVLPNEVRKERGARGPRWRLDAGPSRGSQSTCMACLSPAGPAELGGSHVPLPPTVRSVHLQPPVFGKHCRWGGRRFPPRLALVAGSRDLGRGGLPGWPTPSVHSAHLLVLGKGTRPGLPALWVMTGGVLRAQKGCRQPSISSRCHRDPQLPSVVILVGKGFFFPVCLLSFSPPVFSSES